MSAYDFPQCELELSKTTASEDAPKKLAIETHSLHRRPIVQDQTFTFLPTSSSVPLPSFEILGRGGEGSYIGKNAFNGETSSDDPRSPVHDSKIVCTRDIHARVHISLRRDLLLRKRATCASHCPPMLDISSDISAS